ncbi:MAG TPA: hypothetical protein VFJ62_10385 [Usitatibacter sp.]|nr:hypothetical protein [Usitatibacter sp.]
MEHLRHRLAHLRAIGPGALHGARGHRVDHVADALAIEWPALEGAQRELLDLLADAGGLPHGVGCGRLEDRIRRFVASGCAHGIFPSRRGKLLYASHVHDVRTDRHALPETVRQYALGLDAR